MQEVQQAPHTPLPCRRAPDGRDEPARSVLRWSWQKSVSDKSPGLTLDYYPITDRLGRNNRRGFLCHVELCCLSCRTVPSVMSNEERHLSPLQRYSSREQVHDETLNRNPFIRLRQNDYHPATEFKKQQMSCPGIVCCVPSHFSPLNNAYPGLPCKTARMQRFNPADFNGILHRRPVDSFPLHFY